MAAQADSAVVFGEGSREYNALLARVHEAMTMGSSAPARPRDVIAGSWQRARQRGLRVDRNSKTTSVRERTEAHGLAADRWGESGDRLRRLSALLRPHASSMIDDGAALLVVSDADGTIVDTAGRGRIRDRAEEIGFLPDHSWAEPVVGTNAIGTALVTKRPVAVHGAEHYLLGQHGWSCAASPIRDPWTGVVIGAIDLSVPVDQAHPLLLPLVSSLARTAALELSAQHRGRLDRLRAVALGAARGSSEPWVVVDHGGWVADSFRVDARRRLALASDIAEGPDWIAPIGEAVVEEVDGGWLIRAAPHAGDDLAGATTLVEVRRTASGAELQLVGASRRRIIAVTPRQADILVLLARSERGLTAAALSARLYGTPERDVTVRAEISRLRRSLGSLLAAGPYRFATGVVAKLVDEPFSGAPRD